MSNEETEKHRMEDKDETTWLWWCRQERLKGKLKEESK